MMIYLCLLLYALGSFLCWAVIETAVNANHRDRVGDWLVILFWPLFTVMVIYSYCKEDD